MIHLGAPTGHGIPARGATPGMGAHPERSEGTPHTPRPFLGLVVTAPLGVFRLPRDQASARREARGRRGVRSAPTGRRKPARGETPGSGNWGQVSKSGLASDELGVHAGVDASLGYEAFVGAAFYDATVVEHEDQVGTADGAEAVGDDEAGAALK